MVHPERLEIGEKCFVSGIMATLATEAVLTIISCGMHFSWIGLTLGVAGFGLILLLANRLYAGSRSAHRVALGWIGFQVIYAGFALFLMVSSAQGMEKAQQIGAAAAWPVILKVVVYLILGWILVRMPTVRYFFADKRGDIKAHEILAQKAAVAQQPGTSLEFNADQKVALTGLASSLRGVVAALIFLGILQMFASVLVMGLKTLNPQGIFVFLQGLLTLILGLALGAPSNEIRLLTNPEDQTKEQLMSALDSLAQVTRVQIIVGLLLAAVIAARFIFILPPFG